MTTTIDMLNTMTMTQILELINMKERTADMSMTRIELLTKQNRKLQKKVDNFKELENLFNQAIQLKKKHMEEEEGEEGEEGEQEEVPVKPKAKAPPKATPAPKSKLTDDEKIEKRKKNAEAKALRDSEIVECEFCHNELTRENLRRHQKQSKKCIKIRERQEQEEKV